MAIDSDAAVPIEHYISMLALPAVAWWPAKDATGCDESIVQRQDQIVALVAPGIPKPAIASFRAALAKADPSAQCALGEINAALVPGCAYLHQRCTYNKDHNQWEELSHNAEFAMRVATACGRRDFLSQFCFFLAIARRAAGDNLGVVKAYEQAIDAAAGLPNEKSLRGAAHDNMANALADLQRFDDAFEHYQLALQYETDPRGISSILANQAKCMQELGEFRSAGGILAEQITRLEAAGIGGAQLAIALDGNARSLIGLGQLQAAIEMLERAKVLFPADDLFNRAINAMVTADAHNAKGDFSATATAFELAHDLALRHAKATIDAEFYRSHFASALAVATDPQSYAWFVQGVGEKEKGNPTQALENFQKAEALARAANDFRWALRIKANIASLFSDFQEIDPAIKVCLEVRKEAAARGLARPELMVIGTLAGLQASGADVAGALGPLALLARSAALMEVHTRIVKTLNLSPAEIKMEIADTGQTWNELGSLAGRYSAHALGATYLKRGVEIAESIKPPILFQLINRLAGLRKEQAQLADSAATDETAAKISALLESAKLPLLGLIVGHRAMAAQLRETSPPEAIDHLRKALQAAEQIRLRAQPGPARADVDWQYRDLPYTLSEAWFQGQQYESAFDALQLAKGRRLIEAMSARRATPADHADTAPTLKESNALLASAAAGSILIDLAMEADSITAYVLAEGKMQTVRVAGKTSSLTTVEQGDASERERQVMALCLRNPMLRELAESIAAVVPKGRPLAIVSDRALHNLPLHAIPVQGAAWADRNPIGYLPSVALLRFRRDAVSYPRALVAGDSRGDLSGARQECERIGLMLNAKPLIGPACTRAAIEHALREEKPDIVHLAVHGRGDPRYGALSSLLFADGRGDTEWMAFDALTAFPWTARLVAFSGCSTCVTGQQHGSRLLSVANAALEAGAETVLASQWPVDDQYTRLFMTAFYEGLHHAIPSGSVDLRLLLDEARNQTNGTPHNPEPIRRDGRHAGFSPGPTIKAAPDPEVAKALTWAPFCLIGNPILRFEADNQMFAPSALRPAGSVK